MMSKLHRCMQEAKRQRNIDLFTYFERVYENEADTDHMFVGIHELCTLTSKRPCPPNTHNTCLAAEFIEAYNQLKVVMMVGKCRLHIPINLELMSGQYNTFEVIKVGESVCVCVIGRSVFSCDGCARSTAWA
jgi:hypothetical protein